MRLALADIEESALDTAVEELRADGVDAIGVRTDVTSFDSVDALAAAVYDEYGVVHVLCNNAGVGPPSAAVWSTTPNDWRWTFSVNVFGVAHGIQAFVPRMLEGGQDGVVVNTSSPDGPISPMPRRRCTPRRRRRSRCSPSASTPSSAPMAPSCGRRSSTRRGTGCSTPVCGRRTATGPTSSLGSGPATRRR